MFPYHRTCEILSSLNRIFVVDFTWYSSDFSNYNTPVVFMYSIEYKSQAISKSSHGYTTQEQTPDYPQIYVGQEKARSGRKEQFPPRRCFALSWLGALSHRMLCDIPIKSASVCFVDYPKRGPYPYSQVNKALPLVLCWLCKASELKFIELVFFLTLAYLPGA